MKICHFTEGPASKDECEEEEYSPEGSECWHVRQGGTWKNCIFGGAFESTHEQEYLNYDD